MKIEFQNRGISLISLENMKKCWIVCLKRAFAHFLRICSICYIVIHSVQSKYHNTSFGRSYPCQTWDTPRTLLYLCPSWSLYIYMYCGKWLEHNRDTYLLFIFSFNLEHLSNYILFTLLNLILGLYFNF